MPIQYPDYKALQTKNQAWQFGHGMSKRLMQFLAVGPVKALSAWVFARVSEVGIRAEALAELSFYSM